jgi:tetratricopeptide (TPR) repeat protein
LATFTRQHSLAYLHRANRLSLGDREAHFALTGIAATQMFLGNYAEALAWATRSLASNPNFVVTLWIVIAANAHLGRTEEAHRFLRELQNKAPGATVARIRASQPDKDPSRIAATLEGLRIAGLDEG